MTKQTYIGIVDGYFLDDIEINLKNDPRIVQFGIQIIAKYHAIKCFLIEISSGTIESFNREMMKIDFVLYATPKQYVYRVNEGTRQTTI